MPIRRSPRRLASSALTRTASRVDPANLSNMAKSLLSLAVFGVHGLPRHTERVTDLLHDQPCCRAISTWVASTRSASLRSAPAARNPDAGSVERIWVSRPSVTMPVSLH